MSSEGGEGRSERRTSRNVVWHNAVVTRERRERLNGHRAAAIWFTGLSGSGKSTLAHTVEGRLHDIGVRTFVFDGDNVRHGLCSDLGFSPEDRAENLRRIGEMLHLFLQAGVVSLAAFISPYHKDREIVRRIVGPDDFLEVYLDCPIEVCESRDVKGLYRRARLGEIKEFTGVSAPYEAPLRPELKVDSAATSLEESANRVMELLVDRGIVPAASG
jgi:adenylylsulfate kinase